jgi:hypothetical protein
LCWFGPFFLLYCFYGPYEEWWYTRYLLPAAPALLFGAAFVLEDLIAVARTDASRPRGLERRALRAAAAGLALLVFLAACGRGLQIGRRYRVLDMGRGEAVYPETIRWAAARVPANAVIAAMQFSGAMKAYGWGTFIRWDYIDAARFPAVRRQIEARGYRLYALVFPFEARDAAVRLPGAWTYLGSNRDVGLYRLD